LYVCAAPKIKISFLLNFSFEKLSVINAIDEIITLIAGYDKAKT
jgi:hypothetical protein